MKFDEETGSRIRDYLIKSLGPSIDADDPTDLANYFVEMVKNTPKEELGAKLEQEVATFLLPESDLDVGKYFQEFLGLFKENGKNENVTFVEPYDPANSSFSTIENTSSHREVEDEDRDRRHRRDEGRNSDDFGSSKRRRREDDYGNDRHYRNDRRNDYEDRSRNFNRRENNDRGNNEFGRGRGRAGRNNRFNDRRDNYDRKRERCKDYDERGYCIRGELCPYEHGNDRIIVNDQSLNGQNSQANGGVVPYYPNVVNPMSSSSLGVLTPNSGMVDPLQSGNISMGLPMFNNVMGFPNMMSQQPYNPDENLIQVGGQGMNPQNNNGNSHGRKNFHERNYNNDRKSYGDNNEHGRNRNRREKDFDHNSKPNPTNTTLAVANVPSELNTIDQLNTYFKKFGKIVNIQVKQDYSKAFVQFSTNEEAEAALNSSEAVFGNRFVKIFWAKRQYPSNSEHKNQSGNSSTLDHQSKRPPNFPSSQSVAPVQQVVPIITDTAVTKEREREAEKAKLNAKMKELQKQKEDVRKAQLEQTKSLLDQLTKTKDPAEKEQLRKRIQSLTEDVEKSIAKDSTTLEKRQTQASPVPALPKKSVSREEKEKDLLDKDLEMISQKVEENEGEMSNMDRLQKTYNNLQKTAASMGIDTSSPLFSQSAGRGRGSGRGRGGKTRGGASAMRLDNRTTTLAIVNIPDDVKDEDLNQHFKTFGEITALNRLGKEQSAALVHFSNRRSAEQALLRGKSLKSHTLQMVWSDKPSSKSNLSFTYTNNSSTDSTKNPNEEEDVEVVSEVYGGNDDDYDEDEEDKEERSWKR